MDATQLEHARKLIEAEAEPGSNITVDDELHAPHVLIVRAQRCFRNAIKDESQILIPRAKKYLDIRISQGSLDRAFRIMDALIKALENRSIPITIREDHDPSTIIEVLGEEFGIGIEEIIDRREIPLTKEQKAEKEKRPWMFDRPSYSKHPTGRLLLQLKGGPSGFWRKNWTDGKIQRVESLLNKFVVSLFECAVKKRTERMEKEIREVQAMEKRRKAEELKEQQRIEQERLQELNRGVEAWHRSQAIRTFVEAVRASSQEDDLVFGRHRAADWIPWALQQADRIDPLRESPYAVLDETLSRWGNVLG